MNSMSNLYDTRSLSRIHGDWALMVASSHLLADPTFRSEALEFSRQIMRRAKSCIDKIANNLDRSGYRFVDPSKVIQAPEADVCDWVKEYEDKGVFLPISLQALLGVVGNVDLRGTHPNWARPAFLFEDMEATSNVWYTDPLVIELKRDHVDYQFEEWDANRVDGEPVPPFSIAISPDHIHKANISGGAPYEVATNKAVVDSILLNERHCTSITGYIRTALSWGGFPGFEYVNNVPQYLLGELRENAIML